jgi:phosphoribosyl 1,2-cyclic phosphate phosphodiesterase
MQVYGFRFGRFTYITDANRIEEAERKKIIGSDTIVLNALRKEKHISHFNLGEATTLVSELNIPHAYFTHISHQLGRHTEVERLLPEGMHLAYDEMTLSF